MTYRVQNPVVLFIYKRQTNFLAIFRVLRQVKPRKLYLISDGPHSPDDQALIDETRQTVEGLIDWPCQISKNYSSHNLGLKARFKSGIDWVFKSETQAIFIEDDCIPDHSFFPYCDELLKRYAHEHQVATISGDNFLFGNPPVNESYYFSRYPLIWGWATWKRAWQGYDPDLRSWNLSRPNPWLRQYLNNNLITLYWTLIFNHVKKGVINTWDYQLTYHCFQHQMLHIIPQVNLVTNVGVDNLATHTKLKNKILGQPSHPISFPLTHPLIIKRNQQADAKIEKTVFLTPIIAISLLLKSIWARLTR